MQQMWTDIDHYIESHLIPEDPVLTQTLENTDAKGFPDHLAVAANQGMLLQMLIQMNQCKRVLELGTFAAYSTMWLARALPEDGYILTIEGRDTHAALGQENIDKSLNALALGALMVVLTILLYYSWAGFIAILALLLNVFFILGTLSSFGTVLTLSGIAGLVLTMGMAVDANVIIYERIKEELALGKSLKQSIVDGFHHSYSAIIDGNLTTILTAIILAYFGLGPVKGFAVVLIMNNLENQTFKESIHITDKK